MNRPKGSQPEQEQNVDFLTIRLLEELGKNKLITRPVGKACYREMPLFSLFKQDIPSHIVPFTPKATKSPSYTVTLKLQSTSLIFLYSQELQQ